MTNQEAYNIALFKLREQGCAAVDNNGACRYRGPNGTKCAVGHMIPDELYDAGMEGRAYAYLSTLEDLHSLFQEVDHDLIVSLQEAHDFVLARLGQERWEARMKEIAQEYGLTYTPAAA